MQADLEIKKKKKGGRGEGESSHISKSFDLFWNESP